MMENGAKWTNKQMNEQTTKTVINELWGQQNGGTHKHSWKWCHLSVRQQGGRLQHQLIRAWKWEQKCFFWHNVRLVPTQ